MGLTVNREKTKLLNLDAERSSLTFLGYEFRKVRDRLFGTGKRYLHFGPSPKSVKRVCQEVHKHTHSSPPSRRSKSKAPRGGMDKS